MSDFVSFNPLVPAWVALLLLLMVSFFVWKEWRRKLKFKILRVIAQAIVFLSLAALLFRPGWMMPETTNGILVLTPGYHLQQVDSLIAQHPELALFHVNDVRPYRNSKLLDDGNVETLALQLDWVVGEGLPLSWLERMPIKKFTLLPTMPTTGIIAWQLPEEAITGKENFVRGTIANKSDRTVRLLGPEGVEDSVLLPSGTTNFSLSFTPKVSGLLLYQLQVDDLTEKVPIVAVTPQPLRILFLQKFPSAETRTLKNFLEQQRHAIVMRQQISKGKYSYAFSTTAPVSFETLTQKVLESFDLMMIDEQTLAQLSSGERAEVMKAVESGLGIHVLPWESFKNISWLLPPPSQKAKTDTVHLRLRLSYTLARMPAWWVEADGMVPVLKVRNEILSGYFLMGRGKISLLNLRETYPIRLQGQERDYAQLWSELISRTSRAHQTEKLRMTSSFPHTTGEPLSFQLISSGDPPSVTSDDEPVSLLEDESIDGVWSGKIWAGAPGWHTLAFPSDSLHYFVSQADQWKSLRVAQQIMANTNISANSSIQPTTALEHREISPLVYFFFFLVASGFLWLAPKL